VLVVVVVTVAELVVVDILGEDVAGVVEVFEPLQATTDRSMRRINTRLIIALILYLFKYTLLIQFLSGLTDCLCQDETAYPLLLYAENRLR
jgi:hypothetical protein